MSKTLCECEYCTRFCRGSVLQQRISGGGGECEDAAFSTVYMPIQGVLRKEPLLLAHSCEDRYSLQAAEGQKAQYCLGVLAQMPYGAHSLNCSIEKG
jgi:hypothetical protein